MNLLGVLKYSAYGVMIGVPLSGAFYHSVGNVSEISGRSMRPTLNPENSPTSDIVWVKRWGLDQYKPRPGDIITLVSPNNPANRIVKRVIATEGDVIRNSFNHYVKIPIGHCWIEGDNSRHSQDSNSFGPVSTGLICGRVTHILWPIKRWQSIANKLLSHQVDHLCGSDDDSIGLLNQQQLDILNHLNDQYDND